MNCVEFETQDLVRRAILDMNACLAKSMLLYALLVGFWLWRNVTENRRNKVELGRRASIVGIYCHISMTCTFLIAEVEIR